MKVWAIFQGRDALRALVPAAFGHYFREARQLPGAQPRRHRHYQVYGQEPHPGRARCLELPQRRPACHLRGPWLHRSGSHQPRLYQGRCPVHPHGFLLLHRARPMDKKTPLLRSMTALSRESKRVLALFGKTPKKVVPSVGDEQEYFLIKKDAYRRRKDPAITGRTLFGGPRLQGARGTLLWRYPPHRLAYMKTWTMNCGRLAFPLRPSTTRSLPASMSSPPSMAKSTRPSTRIWS